MLTLQQALF